MSNENIYEIIYENICKECNQINTRYKWCNACNAKHFKQNFKKWTSGNDDIDKFIQDTQLSAKRREKVLEWIDFMILNILQKVSLAKYIEQMD